MYVSVEHCPNKEDIEFIVSKNEEELVSNINQWIKFIFEDEEEEEAIKKVSKQIAEIIVSKLDKKGYRESYSWNERRSLIVKRKSVINVDNSWMRFLINDWYLIYYSNYKIEVQVGNGHKFFILKL